MAVLVGVLLLYVFELGRSRRLLLKAGNARKALRGSEELFRSIMQNVHAFILLIDRDFIVTRTNYYDITKARKPEGRLTRVGDLLRCNNALSAEGGCGTHELCGSCPIRRKIEETFRSKSNFTDLEAVLDIRDRRGEVSECDAYVSGEYMEIDDKEGMVITVHDITRLKKAEAELKKLEDRREFLQPVMDNVSKEIKEYGMIKTFLPEATALERAITYRDKKIKPLFIEMKNKIGAMAAQVKELTRERDSWKSKFQKKKQEHEKTKEELAEVQKDYQKLSGEKEILQGIADRYNRLLRMLGKDMVERLVQDDIRMQTELEAKKQKEQMPKKIGDRIQWARERSEEHNAKIKKNKAKYRGMEL